MTINCWGYSSNPDPCPTNHAVWILPLSGLLIDLRKERQYCSKLENEDWPWDRRSLLFPTICESENSQLSEISPSQFILLCLSPYSTQFLYPYKLPISLYLTPGILVIKYQVEFWGKVSGSVVTCQYWIGRRLPNTILYTVFLACHQKIYGYTVAIGYIWLSHLVVAIHHDYLNCYHKV